MKELSKFEVAAIKRTAANVEKFVEKKNKLKEKLATLQAEYDTVCKALDSWQAPIKEITGGYTTEDLVEKEKNEKGVVKFVLRYPETKVPTDVKWVNDGLPQMDKEPELKREDEQEDEPYNSSYQGGVSL